MQKVMLALCLLATGCVGRDDPQSQSKFNAQSSVLTREWLASQLALYRQNERELLLEKTDKEALELAKKQAEIMSDISNRVGNSVIWQVQLKEFGTNEEGRLTAKLASTWFKIRLEGEEPAADVLYVANESQHFVRLERGTQISVYGVIESIWINPEAKKGEDSFGAVLKQIRIGRR